MGSRSGGRRYGGSMATTLQTGAFDLLPVLIDVLPREGLSEILLAQRVLLDPNIRPAGVVAAVDEAPVGAVVGVGRHVPLENAQDDSHRGYITLFGVVPSHRRRGVGSQLLRAAEAHLGTEGRKEIWISPYAPNYFSPGVDVEANPEALAFFESHGYREIYRPLAMQMDLWVVARPTWLDEKIRALEDQGVVLVSFSPALIPQLLAFTQRHFPGDWVRVVRETSREILQGADRNRLMAAIDAEGRVLGFSHYAGERFGPIGVDEEERGRGIGQWLMHATLAAQRAAGLRSAYFLWTDDRTAERLYYPAGFRPARRFAVLRKFL